MVEESAAVRPRLLTVADVCRILGVNRKVIYAMAKAGDLPAIRLTRGPKARWRFDRADVERAIERLKVAA
jgi:excisionase family DNA binding protein